MQSISLQPSNMYPKWNYSVPNLYSKTNAIQSNVNGQLYDIGRRKDIDKPIGEFNSPRPGRKSYSAKSPLPKTCVFTRDIVYLENVDRGTAREFSANVASNKRYNWIHNKRNSRQRKQHRQFGLHPDTRLAICAGRSLG